MGGRKTLATPSGAAAAVTAAARINENDFQSPRFQESLNWLQSTRREYRDKAKSLREDVIR